MDTERTRSEIERIRLARGWSQAQLAERLGINQSTVSRIETGAAEANGPLRKLIERLVAEEGVVE